MGFNTKTTLDGTEVFRNVYDPNDDTVKSVPKSAVDQTGAEIKSLYEGEADTNAFADANAPLLSEVETWVANTLNVSVSDSLNGTMIEYNPNPYTETPINYNDIFFYLINTGVEGNYGEGTIDKITINGTDYVQEFSYDTGKIKVTKAGYPCVYFHNQDTANRVTLRDIVLINDGTVPVVRSDIGAGTSSYNLINGVTNYNGAEDTEAVRSAGSDDWKVITTLT